MNKPTSFSLIQRIKTLKSIVSGEDKDNRKAFIDYHLIRRKFVLSCASKHFKKDKLEPAPLLDMTLLDIGCGTNRMSQELSLRGAICTGVDIDTSVIEEAEQTAKKYGAPVSFFSTSAESLVQQGNTYDIILCFDVLEHSDNPQKLLWAIKKLLAPNGIIVFSTINKTFSSFIYHKIIAEYILHWVPAGTHKTNKFLTPKKLEELFNKEGLHINNSIGVSYSPYTKEWYKTSNKKLRYMGTAILGKK